MKRKVNRILADAIAFGVLFLAGAASALEPVAYLDWDPATKTMTNATCTAYEIVTTETETFADNKWYVVPAGADISRASSITVDGAAHLILCDGGKLKVELNSGTTAGIQVSASGAVTNSLAIYGQALGTGELFVRGNSAGIGGGFREDGGMIAINGGTVTAAGYNGGAGVGGGNAAAGGTVTINGGTVTASSDTGAGIGGGYMGNGGTVTVNGGMVTATGVASGGYYASAGIGGGGNGGKGGMLVVNGGKVIAVGGGVLDGVLVCSGIGHGEGASDEGSLALAAGLGIIVGADRDSAVLLEPAEPGRGAYYETVPVCTVTVGTPEHVTMAWVDAAKPAETNAVAGGLFNVVAGHEISLVVTADEGHYVNLGGVLGTTVVKDLGAVTTSRTVDSPVVKELPRITYTVNHEGAGTATGPGSAVPGETVTVAATANENWKFSDWSGDDEIGAGLGITDSSELTATFTAKSTNMTVVANFKVSDTYRNAIVASITNNAAAAIAYIDWMYLSEEDKQAYADAINSAKGEQLDAIIGVQTPDEVDAAKAAAEAAFSDIVDQAGRLRVQAVSAAQHAPWNGLADIDYTVVGVARDAAGVWVAVTSGGVTKRATTLTGDVSGEPGEHRMTWNFAADWPNLDAEDVQIEVGVGAAEGAMYCVVDLSGGESAASYPVKYLFDSPEGGFNIDAYKKDKLVLKICPAGSYIMGDDQANESHRVTLTKPFYLGLFETTQAQWKNVTGLNPATDVGETKPVSCVSYDDIRGAEIGTNWPVHAEVDAANFLGKLRQKTGLAFDLPTEAQWEYVCRAGTTTTNSFGDAAADDYMWCQGIAGGHVHEVGTKLANPWGFYDMYGNVAEWCLDWWGGDPVYGDDPKGSLSGLYRMSRGGNLDTPSKYCTSSERGCYYLPSLQGPSCGFRLARTLSAAASPLAPVATGATVTSAVFRVTPPPVTVKLTNVPAEHVSVKWCDSFDPSLTNDVTGLRSAGGLSFQAFSNRTITVLLIPDAGYLLKYGSLGVWDDTSYSLPSFGRYELSCSGIAVIPVSAIVCTLDGKRYTKIEYAIDECGKNRPLTDIAVLDPDAPCPEGYKIQNGAVIRLSDQAARIGEVYYATIDGAIAAAVDGDTVTLNKHLEIPGPVTIAGKKLTIDFNGKYLGNGMDILAVSAGANLTLVNPLGTGLADMLDCNLVGTITVAADSSLVIYGGTYDRDVSGYVADGYVAAAIRPGKTWKVLPWVSAPVARSGLVYNGAAQRGVEVPDGVVPAGGSAEEASAGEHSAAFRPADGFAWRDGTLADVTVAFTIAPAPLTVTADDKRCRIGEAPPEYTFTAAGFVAGEDGSVFTQPPAFDCAYAKGDTFAGDLKTYEIVPSGAVAANYEITFASGTLTVEGFRDALSGLVDRIGPYGEICYEKGDPGVLEVRLTNDVGSVTLDCAEADEDVEIVLDLNGHGITADPGADRGYGLRVAEGTRATIRDSAGGGRVSGEKTAGEKGFDEVTYPAAVSVAGALVIEGGVYDGAVDVGEGGSLEIRGGKFRNADLELWGCSRPMVGDEYRGGITYPTGRAWRQDEDGSWELVAEAVVECDGTAYTLGDFAAALAGGTLVTSAEKPAKLLRDLAADAEIETFEVAPGVVLHADLNGFTLSSLTAETVLCVKGELFLHDSAGGGTIAGTVDAAGGGFCFGGGRYRDLAPGSNMSYDAAKRLVRDNEGYWTLVGPADPKKASKDPYVTERDELIALDEYYGPFMPGAAVAFTNENLIGCAQSGLTFGIKFNKKTGVFSGVPTKPGVYKVTFKKTVKDAGTKRSVSHVGSAVFLVDSLRKVTVEVGGAGRGKVTPATSAAAVGKTVTLRATAEKDSVFSGWYVRGACVSREAKYKYTVDEDAEQRVTAQFILRSQDSNLTQAVKIERLAADGEPERIDFGETQTVVVGVPVLYGLEVKANTAAKVQVTKLPAGLRFASAPVTTKKTETVNGKKVSTVITNVPANTIYGVPTAVTKGEKQDVLVKVTTASKASMTYVVPFRVAALPGWATGTYDGVYAVTPVTPGAEEAPAGTVTLTISRTGGASGKVITGGKTYSFSATSYDAPGTNGALAVTVTPKCGKDVLGRFTLHVGANGAEEGADGATPYLTGAVFGRAADAAPGAARSVHLVQNVWKFTDRNDARKAFAPVFPDGKGQIRLALKGGLEGLTATLKPKGAVSVSGKLADENGRPVSVNVSAQILRGFEDEGTGVNAQFVVYKAPTKTFRGLCEVVSLKLAIGADCKVTAAEVYGE